MRIFIGIGHLIGINGNISITGITNHNSRTAEPFRLPSNDVVCYLGYGAMEYKYEWGWDNYETGTLIANQSIYSKETSPGICGPMQITWTVSGAATKGSYNWGSAFVSVNASNGYVMISHTIQATFHASDFFQSNTDDVMITIHFTTYPTASGTINANSNTAIDWTNIFEVAISVAGS